MPDSTALIKLSRGQWVLLRDGRLIKAEYLPGDDWPGWWNPVPEGVIGGPCREGYLGWPSTQSGRLSEVAAVYNNYEDARGWPPARGAVVV